jgi:hypothetical protein
LPLTDKSLEEQLAADGWPFERLDATTWRSGFQAASTDRFRFFLRLTRDWLYLTIVPFITLPEDSLVELRVLRRLLMVNREITLAKFALEGRDVVLTVELPIQDLAPSQLKDGLDALSYYAMTHHPELSRLANAQPS